VELRQLKAFVAVATEGHLGRAAGRLNLTQPGLTLRIQALEKELGVQLLERNAREVQLTAAGAVLLPMRRACSGSRIERCASSRTRRMESPAACVSPTSPTALSRSPARSSPSSATGIRR